MNHTEDIFIEDDGILLSASLDMPESGETKHPVTVLIHGLTGNREEPHILAISRALTLRGFAVLRADMYGHGESGGEFRRHTILKWMNNALTLIDYAQKLPFAGEIFLCGHSQGGLTAVLAAAMKRDIVKAVIPLSPAIFFPDEARHGRFFHNRFDPDRVPEEVVLDGGQVLDGNYIRTAQMIRVEDAIDFYRGPALIVHGDADTTVPCHYGRETAERYQNGTFIALPGDTHCFDLHMEEMAEIVAEWLCGQQPGRAHVSAQGIKE